MIPFLIYFFPSNRNNLKTSILIQLDNEASMAYEQAFCLLMTGQKLNADELFKQIDGIGMNEIKNFGQKLLKSKPALVSIGINHPYLSDLE